MLIGCNRRPLTVKEVSYIVYSGDTLEANYYVISSNGMMKMYDIKPEDTMPKPDELFSGNHLTDYQVSEYKIDKSYYESLVLILTRNNFMELKEDLSIEGAYDAPSYYIQVQTEDHIHQAGGYNAGYGDDSDQRRFKNVLDAITLLIDESKKG